MKRGAFLDSGVFIAFLVRSDRSHEDAVGLFSRPPRRLRTSVLVVSETYGWLLHRLGEGAGRAFRSLLESLPTLEVWGTDHQLAVEGARVVPGATTP